MSTDNNNNNNNNNNNDDDHVDEANKKAYKALLRLSLALADLNDKEESPFLSHWRTNIPDEVNEAHEMMTGGAELIKATSTKYTLVGKVDVHEGAKMAQDLRQGAELVATGALVLHDTSIGASRSYRKYAKQCARAVVVSLSKLVQCFLDGSALPANADALHDGSNTIGAQRTGAVWETCDAMVKCPKGNRAAMRRDLLTWAMECNETMQEFQSAVDLGPLADEEEEEEDNYDSFGADDQYTSLEIPVATACLALLKCSRGTINLTLKACECAGEQINQSNHDDDDNNNKQQQQRNSAILSWINKLHSMARIVGEGITDLGMAMYPPLKENYDALQAQVATLDKALVVIHEMILDATPIVKNGDDGEEELERIEMSEEVMEMANKLHANAFTREKEVKEAVLAATTCNKR